MLCYRPIPNIALTWQLLSNCLRNRIGDDKTTRLVVASLSGVTRRLHVTQCRVLGTTTSAPATTTSPAATTSPQQTTTSTQPTTTTPAFSTSTQPVTTSTPVQTTTTAGSTTTPAVTTTTQPLTTTSTPGLFRHPALYVFSFPVMCGIGVGRRNSNVATSDCTHLRR